MIVFEDIEEMTAYAAGLFVSLCASAVGAKGFFSVVLSGGSTPRGLFRRLASEEFRLKFLWERVHLFWGDERTVPHDDEESNFGMAAKELIAKVPIPPENVHRIHAELKPAAAAKAYEAEVKAFFKTHSPTALPEFDLVFLGLGADGHTLSLFPGSKALCEDEKKRLVVENYVEALSQWRITMTAPLVNGAKVCVFMASGALKRDAIKDIFEEGSMALPAGLIRPAGGRLFWLVDRAAASGLKQLRR